MWLIPAFLAPALYACANVFDNVLINRKFKNPFILVFYTSLFNIVFLPILFLIQRPVLPATHAIPAFIGLGLVNLLYLYPYYRGLQTEDTSVAVSFFSLGRIFIPILAHFVIGEILTATQYAGIFLIIMSGVLLGLSRDKLRLRFSKAFWYIMVAAFIISFEGVLLKYLFGAGINWSTAIGGELIISFVLGISLLLYSRARKEILSQLTMFKSNIYLFGIEETFTFLAFAAEAFAIKLAPVSLAKSISTFTPFFVLLYAFLLGNKLPYLFKERVTTGSSVKKIALFTTMVLGVLLIAS